MTAQEFVARLNNKKTLLTKILDGDHKDFVPVTDEETMLVNESGARYTRDFKRPNEQVMKMVWFVENGKPEHENLTLLFAG